MLLSLFRGIFVVMVISVLMVSAASKVLSDGDNSESWWAVVISGLGLVVFFLLLDILTPKRKLTALAGVFFGLLVGMLITAVLAKAVDMIGETYRIPLIPEANLAIKWMLGIGICYFTISIVMRTKDDFRFVIPYIAFAKQTKGMRPLILDTSAIVDGRIADLCESRLFDAPVVVPRFVLNELQLIADSSDKLKRNRGRRGLDVLKKMQASPTIDVEIDETTAAEIEEAKGVDQKLLLFTKVNNGRLATTDYNLTKVAQVRGVDVININDLANSLKVVALPGETMRVRIVKPGEEADQGIGYLDDGTMIVVEGARNKIGKDIVLSVTSSLQTSAGKMIFGRFESFVSQDSEGDTWGNEGGRRHGFRRSSPAQGPASTPNPSPTTQSG
ncbi:MAG TPA: TRAM domain-containing protein [Sedimentisphaerales bacterium]|nr:TRAM domain-containing protein [Sedimentisphaerales bacterium]